MTTTPDAATDTLAANTIRILAAEAIQKAGSGHPGLPMGAADMAYVLFSRFLKFDPTNPQWPDRDRFVLSAGHGSMLIYSLLHLAGYDVSLEDLRNFRQLDSRTPGHPEYGDTDGVETTTGPLGQGVANGVGMALAERLDAGRYNSDAQTVVDHFTYVLCSDGDLMEGISHEAASLAGHLGLGKLIALYDDNDICLDGPTSMTFSEDIAKRFDSYGWQTQRVDGHDQTAIADAIAAAQAETGRPSIILCKTKIGKGSPNKEGKSAAHGAPLGEDELEATKKSLGWTAAPFTVPEEVRPVFRAAAERGAASRAAWEKAFANWAAAEPAQAERWKRTRARELPAGWKDALPRWSPSDKPVATRSASGAVINAIAELVPELIGGSADLACSNNTEVKAAGAVSREDFSERNLWFGVREHAMGAILNGMSVHGGIRPYGATFLTFSDYVRPAVRLAAMMSQPVIFVFTHDSIFLGEDGPTHQPIEHVAALRTIPNLNVIRPADGNETAAAWASALERTDGPTALILSRQGLPHHDETGLGRGAERGGYIVKKESSGTPDLIFIATGSELETSLAAAALLETDGTSVRVVSMPSQEIFDAQPAAYREKILPAGATKRVSVEAGVTQGWQKYVGSSGLAYGIEGFGASAPIADLREKYGFTPEAIAQAARGYLAG